MKRRRCAPSTAGASGGHIVNTSQWTVLIVLLLGLALTACNQQPEISDKTNSAGLADVKHSGMTVAMADPNAHFAQYKSVLIADLDFSQLQIIQPQDSSPRYGKFTLSDEDKEALSKGFREQVGKELSDNGGYTVITDLNTQPSPALLVLVAQMVRLQPNAPREKSAIGVDSARDRTYTPGAGSMTLEAKLVDSSTGKTVALVGDTLTDTDVWAQNDPVSNRGAVERAFSDWGRALRHQLQSFSTASAR
jgi:Protein of unknown function (DUF3313)